MAAGRLTHTLALTGRSIRADENKLWLHLVRGLVAVFLVFLMMIFVAEMGQNDAPGLLIFQVVASINTVAVILAGIAFFPSTITEEKEARTLGLLRMADVGPMAVIAGKVLPRLSMIVVLLMMQVPIVLLAVTLGGITWEHVGKAFLAMTIFSVTLCSLATLFSVLCKTTRNSASLLVVVLIAVPLLTLLAMGIISEVFGYRVTSGIADWMSRWLLPLVFWMHVFDLYGTSVIWDNSFQYFALVNLAVAAVLFGLAWLLFDRAIDTSGQSDLPRPIGLKIRGKQRRSRRAWSRSIAWKDFWFSGGGMVGVGIRMVAYPLLAIALSLIDGGSAVVNVGDYLAGITMLCFPIEVAVICSRLFRHDLDNHTWSSLMMLPRTFGGVVGEKILGGLIPVAPSVFWFTFALFLRPEIVRDMLRSLDRDPETIFVYMVFAAEFFMATFLITLFSLKSRYGSIPLTLFLLLVGNVGYGFLMAVIQPNEPAGPCLFLSFICFVVSVIALEQIRKMLFNLAARDE